MKKLFITLMMFSIILGLFVYPSVNAASNVDTAYIRLTLLNQDPDPAEPGKYLELRWKVTKFGNDKLEDLKFELQPEYPFSFDKVDTPIKTVGTWMGTSDTDEYYTLYYKIKVADDALEGDYDLDLGYSYGDGLVTTQTYTVRVGEKIEPELVLGEVKSSPIKLLGDTSENQISIELLNIGDDSAENVYASLDLPDGFKSSYSYSTEKNLGNIIAHSSATSTMYIDIEDYVKEGDYQATLNVKYKKTDDDFYSNLQIPINLEVKGKPTFKIESVEYSKNSIEPGDTVDIKLILKNTGSNDVESVSIKAFKESSQPIEFSEKSDFIGTLNVDETGDGILTLDVDKNAMAKKYLLDIEIRSIYNDEVFIQKEKIPLVIEPKTKAFDSRNILTGILLAVIVILSVLLVKKSK
ncbi:COG1361 S-layer family protein [Candidatus Woesearchaeota archaeon]|nr:COG1361 S-layer family protein [Candidatus Woesearchaeota archaeon]